jgi:hypothetical protein
MWFKLCDGDDNNTDCLRGLMCGCVAGKDIDGGLRWGWGEIDGDVVSGRNRYIYTVWLMVGML